MKRRQSCWLVCPQPRPRARWRLFCFPHAGGGASVFHSWSRLLPEEVEVWSIQLPGRETRLRERPLTDIKDVVAALGREMPGRLDVPCAFFGHSLGAHVGFELARLLRRQKLGGPRHLFVSAAPAPQLPDPRAPIAHLPDKEFVEKLCRRYDGIPAEILGNAELMKILLKALRADVEISETYRCQQEPPLEGPITILGGEEDYLTRDQLAAWREQTLGSCELIMFSGGHFFIQVQQQRILQLIAEVLRQASRTPLHHHLRPMERHSL